MTQDEILTGQYVLLLHLAENVELTIGRLGEFEFPAGWYTYIGSAFGAGGLVGRVRYHLRPVEKPHWHIDYFRQAAQVEEIWLSLDTEKREEDWVDLMLDIPGATIVVDGFGSSDTSKDSHLIYFDVRPLLDDFAVGVRTRFPEAKVLRAFGGDDLEDE